jgi:hypothetical protein
VVTHRILRALDVAVTRFSSDFIIAVIIIGVFFAYIYIYIYTSTHAITHTHILHGSISVSQRQ